MNLYTSENFEEIEPDKYVKDVDLSAYEYDPMADEEEVLRSTSAKPINFIDINDIKPSMDEEDIGKKFMEAYTKLSKKTSGEEIYKNAKERVNSGNIDKTGPLTSMLGICESITDNYNDEANRFTKQTSINLNNNTKYGKDFSIKNDEYDLEAILNNFEMTIAYLDKMDEWLPKKLFSSKEKFIKSAKSLIPVLRAYTVKIK